MFVGTRGTERPQCQRSLTLTKRSHYENRELSPPHQMTLSKRPEYMKKNKTKQGHDRLNVNNVDLIVTERKCHVRVVCIIFLIYRKSFSDYV